MNKIKLQNSNKYALVNDEDFDHLNRYKWYLSGDGYAINNGRGVGSSLMHRNILNPDKGICIHHINENKLDNRRNNLLTCTIKEHRKYHKYGGSKPNRGRYVKWTDELKTKGRFLLAFYKDYDEVAAILEIPPSALKNYNNKYWKIDCKTIWVKTNDIILMQLIKENVSREEIGNIFGVTENAVSIRISQLKKST